MKSTNKSKVKNDISSKAELKNIKSKYILEIIFDYLQTKKSLEVIKYNKILQK